MLGRTVLNIHIDDNDDGNGNDNDNANNNDDVSQSSVSGELVYTLGLYRTIRIRNNNTSCIFRVLKKSIEVILPIILLYTPNI